MSRGWKIAIAISLALNLFLLGTGVGVLVVGTRALVERADLRRGGGDGQRVFAAFQALPPDRRQALREMLRAQAMDAAPDLRAAAQARREANQLMAADHYDAAAVTAALTRARDAEGRARARLDDTLAARLATLTPQERVVFAQAMLRGPTRGNPRGGRGGGRPPGPPPGDSDPPPPGGPDAHPPPPPEG